MVGVGGKGPLERVFRVWDERLEQCFRLGF